MTVAVLSPNSTSCLSNTSADISCGSAYRRAAEPAPGDGRGRDTSSTFWQLIAGLAEKHERETSIAAQGLERAPPEHGGTTFSQLLMGLAEEHEKEISAVVSSLRQETAFLMGENARLQEQVRRFSLYYSSQHSLALHNLDDSINKSGRFVAEEEEAESAEAASKLSQVVPTRSDSSESSMESSTPESPLPRARRSMVRRYLEQSPQAVRPAPQESRSPRRFVEESTEAVSGRPSSVESSTEGSPSPRVRHYMKSLGKVEESVEASGPARGASSQSSLEPYTPGGSPSPRMRQHPNRLPKEESAEAGGPTRSDSSQSSLESSIQGRPSPREPQFLKALRKVPVFAQMDVPFVEKLSEKTEIRHYVPGDFLTLCGKPGTDFFMLRSGAVQALDAHGKPVHAQLLGKGSYFGETFFLVPGECQTSIICVEPCEAMVLPIKAMPQLHLGPALQKKVRFKLHRKVAQAILD